MRPRGIVQLAAWLVAAITISLTGVPTAHASVGLYPGMPIQLSTGGTCSLSFLASNDDGDRLAVTAGHCSTALKQIFYSKDGTKIGYVVSRADDVSGTSSYDFGYTMIRLYSDTTYTATAYFKKYRNPSEGTWVWKYGERTQETEGKIIGVDYSDDDSHPSYSVIKSTMITLPGDSGAPWYTGSDAGPVLVGIHVGSVTRKSDNSFQYSYGFPAHSMIRYIRKQSKNWGGGFNVVGD